MTDYRECFRKASCWANGYAREFDEPNSNLANLPYALLYRAKAVRQHLDMIIESALESIQVDYDSLDFPEAIQYHKDKIHVLNSIMVHDEEDDISLTEEIERHESHILVLQARGTTGYKVNE